MAITSVEADAGSGGASFATDDIASVQYPITKIAIGAAGTANLVAVGNGAVDTGTIRVTLANDSTGVVALSATDNGVLDNIDTNTTDLPNVIGTDGSAGPTKAVSIAGTESGGTLQEIRVDSDGHVQVDVLSVTGTVTVDGSGVTQPVSGTVTANLSTTDNTVLDNIDSNTDFGAVVGGGLEATALRVTLASDSTGVLSIDDNDGSLTVDGSVTLGSNSGVDVGDVDVTSVVPGTGASNLGKAEDAAHTSGDVGVMPLAVRNDDLAALAGTDGDYAPLQVTQNGALLMCPAANDDYKYAAIDAATSGDNTLVAAVASRKIRVLSVFLVAGGDVDARFEDGAAGTALTGQMDLTTNSGFTLPFNPAGWFETSVNTLLNLELSGAISVDGCLTYIEVP